MSLTAWHLEKHIKHLQQRLDGLNTIYAGIVDDSSLVGGMRIVEFYADLLTINNNRRKVGMLVYVQETESVYKLGADNVSWTLFFSAGSSVTYRVQALEDGRVNIPQPRKVIMIGDSLSYNTYTEELQTRLQLIDSDWRTDYLAVGGDTATMCRERLQGGVWHSPVRGVDSLTLGDNDLFIKPYMPPLNDSDTDSAFELGRRRGGCPDPKRAIIYNRGVYAATATERKFIARCAGSNQGILYELCANNKAIVNAGNETAVMTTNISNVVMTRSVTVGSSDGRGAASAKFVLNASAPAFHGMYETVDADSIYEVQADVYIPSVGGIANTVGIGADGTDATYLATKTSPTTSTKDQWVTIQVLIYVPSDGTVISIGSANGAPENGAIFYLDRVSISKKYAAVVDHKLPENFPCWLENITYDPAVYTPLVTVPTGWKEHKNSYVKLSGIDTTLIQLKVTSGGAQDTYTGKGWCFVHCGLQATYEFTPLGGTPDPDDAIDFAFTWEADYPEMGAIWVVWIGANSSLGDEALVRAEIKRIASMCRSGRLVILIPLINSSGTLGSLGREFGNDLRDWIIQEFPDQYIDANAALMASNDGSAQDLTDVGNDVHPTSLRSDAVHLNAAGYSVIADVVYLKLASLGYI